MVRSKDELLNAIMTKYADDTSDDGIALLEDISDTFSDLESKASDSTNWKEKYEQNDKEWRDKYKARFLNTEYQEEDEGEYEEQETPALHFEDLFEIKEDK